MPREPNLRPGSQLLACTRSMSKTRKAAGATSSSSSGGPITCSGAMTSSTSLPSVNGPGGNLLRLRCVLGPIEAAVDVARRTVARDEAAARAIVERDGEVLRAGHREVPLDVGLRAETLPSTVGDAAQLEAEQRGRCRSRRSRSGPAVPVGNSCVDRCEQLLVVVALLVLQRIVAPVLEQRVADERVAHRRRRRASVVYTRSYHIGLRFQSSVTS